MALTANLGRGGFEPQSIHTNATVQLDKGEAGFSITSIAVGGIDAAKFGEIAEETKKSCPVSKALTGTKITLDAKPA